MEDEIERLQQVDDKEGRPAYDERAHDDAERARRLALARQRDLLPLLQRLRPARHLLGRLSGRRGEQPLGHVAIAVVVRVVVVVVAGA